MFVILGIVILAVSFIIALFSLVREEKKRGSLVLENDEKTPPQPSIAPTLGGKKETDAPFPWEAREQGQLSGEIKIGEISKKQQ